MNKPAAALVSALLALLPLVLRAAEPPNIILIMADDIGVECLSCYGSEEHETPHLDALAAAGIRFENAHSQPLCTPSRVQIMTGIHNMLYSTGEFYDVVEDLLETEDLAADRVPEQLRAIHGRLAEALERHLAVTAEHDPLIRQRRAELQRDR